jgi:sirohydrochlorin ferrochelatase
VKRGVLGTLFVGLLTFPVYAQTGLLVVAHGAGPAWNDGVRTTVAQVHWTAGPVATAFLMGPEANTGGWDSAVAKLTRQSASHIVVVPLLVSSHGGHYRDILRAAGELVDSIGDASQHKHAAHRPSVPTMVTGALDDAPELGQALAARWRELTATDRRGPLLLVAHGPTSEEEAALWLRDLEAAAAAIRAEGRTPVVVGLLRDDAPPPVRAAAVQEIRATVTRLASESGDSVTVLPVLISTGQIDQVTIPRDLSGLPIRYRSASLAPLPAIARWIERVARAKAATIP